MVQKIKSVKQMCQPASNAVYGLGLIGAMLYFLANTQTLGDKVLAILKAFVWPVYLIYGIMEFLGL